LNQVACDGKGAMQTACGHGSGLLSAGSLGYRSQHAQHTQDGTQGAISKAHGNALYSVSCVGWVQKMLLDAITSRSWASELLTQNARASALGLKSRHAEAQPDHHLLASNGRGSEKSWWNVEPVRSNSKQTMPGHRSPASGPWPKH
jgi:hypothetical protein